MGLFDKMFGRGASKAEAEPNASQRFDELKGKYQSVLSTADQQHIQFHNFHVEGDKLFIRGTAPSEEAKNKFWDQIKLVGGDDVNADISVDQNRAQAATAGGGTQEGAKTYTVKAGDTLSKISKQHYGDSGEYMRIFYANRDKLKDPDKIQVGQELNIPAENA